MPEIRGFTDYLLEYLCKYARYEAKMDKMVVLKYLLLLLLGMVVPVISLVDSVQVTDV